MMTKVSFLSYSQLNMMINHFFFCVASHFTKEWILHIFTFTFPIGTERSAYTNFFFFIISYCWFDAFLYRLNKNTPCYSGETAIHLSSWSKLSNVNSGMIQQICGNKNLFYLIDDIAGVGEVLDDIWIKGTFKHFHITFKKPLKSTHQLDAQSLIACHVTRHQFVSVFFLLLIFDIKKSFYFLHKVT